MILGPSDGLGLEDDPSPEDDLPHESNLEPKPEIDDVTLGAGNWGVQAPEQVEPVASGSRSEEFPVLKDLLSGTDNASAMAGELERSGLGSHNIALTKRSDTGRIFLSNLCNIEAVSLPNLISHQI